MKRNLIAGMAILLPFALTIWILSFLIDILTAPFLGYVEALFPSGQGESETGRGLLIFAVKILILFFLFVLTFAVGIFAEHFAVRSFVRYADGLLHRIPLVNKIYKAAQDVVKTLFTTEQKAFSQVVLVPFPRANTKCLGFVAKMDQPEAKKLSVFVPGTPNPTAGFILLYDREQVILLDMTVEEALKFLISCGVMASRFQSAAKTAL